MRLTSCTNISNLPCIVHDDHQVEGKKLLTEKFADLYFAVDVIRVCLDNTEATKHGKARVILLPCRC